MYEKFFTSELLIQEAVEIFRGMRKVTETDFDRDITEIRLENESGDYVSIKDNVEGQVSCIWGEIEGKDLSNEELKILFLGILIGKNVSFKEHHFPASHLEIKERE